MQVLKLVEEHNLNVPFPLGKELGYGADGQVFELVNDTTKVIKLSICFNEEKIYSNVESVLLYLLNNFESAYASVYAKKYLGSYTRHLIDGKCIINQKYFLHYYVMEKLLKISDDEKKVFHTILSHEDRNIIKNYSLNKVHQLLDGLNYGLDFDKNKVIFFYQNLVRSPIKHLDLHARNIMKNDKGDFKMIDFDRVKLEN